MFGSNILDVAIGLTLFFLIASLICSSIREALEGLLKLRSRHLERGIRELLDDPSGETLARSIYEHGQVYSLFAGRYDAARLSWKSSKLLVEPFGMFLKWWAGRKLPSYIPSGQFATAMMDVVARGPSQWPYPVPIGEMTLPQLRERVTQLPSARVQRAMLGAIDHAGGDLETARKNIERWFDGSMDRVSGWYKRSTQAWLFVIGLAAAVLMNLDALTVASRLSEDKTLRDAFLVQAEAYTKAPPPQQAPAAGQTTTPADANSETAGQSPKTVAELRRDLGVIGAPTGWEEKTGAGYYPGPQYRALEEASCRGSTPCTVKPGFDFWLPVLFGWLITAVAVTFGAPFWFDLLNKFMVIRATVKPREKSREEGSEDRAGPSGSNDAKGGKGGSGKGDDGDKGGKAPVAPAAGSAGPPPALDPAEQAFEPESWASPEAAEGEVPL